MSPAVRVESGPTGWLEEVLRWVAVGGGRAVVAASCDSNRSFERPGGSPSEYMTPNPAPSHYKAFGSLRVPKLQEESEK